MYSPSAAVGNVSMSSVYLEAGYLNSDPRTGNAIIVFTAFSQDMNFYSFLMLLSVLISYSII